MKHSSMYTSLQNHTYVRMVNKYVHIVSTVYRLKKYIKCSSTLKTGSIKQYVQTPHNFISFKSFSEVYL